MELLSAPGGVGILRQAAFPGKALLHYPDFPAVFIPGPDDPVGKRCIEKERFLFECRPESHFR